MYHSIGFC